MTRRLLVLYLLIVLVPLAVAAAFTLRDLLAQRTPDPSEGNGHAEIEALEHTVEEVQAI